MRLKEIGLSALFAFLMYVVDCVFGDVLVSFDILQMIRNAFSNPNTGAKVSSLALIYIPEFFSVLGVGLGFKKYFQPSIPGRIILTGIFLFMLHFCSMFFASFSNYKAGVFDKNGAIEVIVSLTGNQIFAIVLGASFLVFLRRKPKPTTNE